MRKIILMAIATFVWKKVQARMNTSGRPMPDMRRYRGPAR